MPNISGEIAFVGNEFKYCRLKFIYIYAAIFLPKDGLVLILVNM